MTLRRKARPDRLTLAALVLALLAGVADASPGDDYAAARTALISAYQAGDYAAMKLAAERALAVRPRYPAAMFNLALAKVLGGDAAGSLETLQILLAEGIDFGVADLEEFAPLKELDAWPGYAAAIEKLQLPVGSARVAFTHDVGDFIPEGIAVAPDGASAWLGSIRYGTVRRLGAGAGLIAVPGPHWSVYGMRLAGDRLWFASAAVAQYSPLDPAEAGRTGLYSVPAAGGEVRREWLLPASASAQLLGDLEFGPSGEIFASDQLGGALYRFEPGTGAQETLVPPGRLGSPQGMALSSDAASLYVADYVGGLYRLDTGSGRLDAVPGDASTSLLGIDGLYRYGETLVAIQNGIRPHRVTQLFLSADGGRVTGHRILAMNLPEFDEPNLGQVLGDTFYFIANSHWNRFDADNRLPEGLAGPVVLRLELDSKASP